MFEKDDMKQSLGTLRNYRINLKSFTFDELVKSKNGLSGFRFFS
jgi:hypothetical protein